MSLHDLVRPDLGQPGRRETHFVGTFQDLGRAADVHDLVVRAISGHTTRQMQDHYSSVAPVEVRDGLANVVALGGFREALGNDTVQAISDANATDHPLHPHRRHPPVGHR